ncbi:hypothetical protein BT96DRAFT_1006754 [Gymnopus androsaceus JB14]|uniref:Uncharacterized protein n=1 Tax=Gymnopus androsaceus JB14 TaxID=1447944 RepID=A0A6A4GK78_9AGAR|nr:hypothetical protein BT96DRAFT_1006754 [Gymnopus androsaceus JB14]
MSGCTISTVQLNFNNEEGLSKLGVWLRRKVIACESKLNEAEEVLRKCGFPEDVLQREWDAQIKAQTKPLPPLDYVKDLRKRIMDTSSAPWETATAELELETALQVLRKAEGKVKRKEDSLGKMNARALKTRIRERLRSCKFELDRLELVLSEAIAVSSASIEHTQDSVKRQDPGIAELTQENKAPRNAIAPVKIEMEGLFDLDVDDDIWLDIGLGYDDDDMREMEVLGRGVKYQLGLRKERLCRLFVTWERTIVGVASTEGLPDWGPSVDEVVGARGIHVLGSGIDVAEDGDYDLEFEHEVDGLLVEHFR